MSCDEVGRVRVADRVQVLKIYLLSNDWRKTSEVSSEALSA